MRDTPEHPNLAVPSTEEGPAVRDDLPQDDVEVDYETPNGTMAEPASSSPLPPDSLTRHHPEELADPVTQVTPPRPKRKQPEKEKAKPISTATLQSLLPKRRQPPRTRHRKTEYDFVSEDDDDDDTPLDTSHLDEDEDELSGRLRRQPKKTTPAKKKQSRKSTAPKPTARSSNKPAQSARKSTSKQQQAHKTYGRRATTLDKENAGNDDEDDTPLPENDEEVSMHDAAQSAELEAAKRKFAEVDAWDMEFESMSVEDHRSSSLQWR